MLIDELSPYVRLAMHSNIIPPWHLKRRVIFDYELIYLEKGSFIFIYGDKEYICKKDDIILIHPGIPHSIINIDNKMISQPHVHFDMKYDFYSETVKVSFKDIDEMTQQERKLIRRDILKGIIDTPVINTAQKPLIKKILFDIIDNFQSAQTMSGLKCKIGMLELLSVIISEKQLPLYDREYNISYLIKEYIDNNYTNRITLDTLAAQFNYNKYYIEKKFKENFAIPIKKYYTSVRLDEVKRDIVKGLRITDIVDKYNFSSVYAFSRFFKNSEGISPTAYKESKSNIFKSEQRSIKPA